MKTAGERDDGAVAVLAQGHRADLRRHVPGAHFASVGGAAKHVAAETVDPVEALLLHIPQWSFAQDRLYVDENFDAHLFLPLGVILLSERFDVAADAERLARYVLSGGGHQ